MANLTDSQKLLLRWIIQSVKNSALKEEFEIGMLKHGFAVQMASGEWASSPFISRGAFSALAYAGFLREQVIDAQFMLFSCVVTGDAYKVVDSNFAEPQSTAPAYTYATTIHGGTGIQVGHANQMTLQAAAVATVQAIGDSPATAEQKAEAKRLLISCFGNPVVGKV